jgi:hypothetical protein
VVTPERMVVLAGLRSGARTSENPGVWCCAVPDAGASGEIPGSL